MRVPLLLLLAVGMLGVAACHSASVDAELVNRTAEPLTLVEVDYPSASFGTQTLAPGESFRYRFKVQGAGDLSLVWTDAARQEHHAKGPHLDEHSDGRLEIAVAADGPHWTLAKRAQ